LRRTVAFTLARITCLRQPGEALTRTNADLHYNCDLGVVFGPGQSQAIKQLVVNTLILESSQPAKYNLEADRPLILESQQRKYRDNFDK
jgi:hypothetical protein